MFTTTLLVFSAIIALCSGLAVDPNDPQQKFHYDHLQEILKKKQQQQQLQLKTPEEPPPTPQSNSGILSNLLPTGILPSLPSLLPTGILPSLPSLLPTGIIPSFIPTDIIPTLPSLSSFDEYEKGKNDLKNKAYDLGNNQIKNAFDITGEVIKGTNQVLNENSNQIKRINSANADMFKQAGRTVGSGFVKVPQVGTSVLSGVEDFFNHPFGFLNLFRPSTFLKFAWTMMPWYKENTEEEGIRVALKTLQTTNSALYYKLIDNPSTYNFFNKHPKAFEYLLENPSEIEYYMDNPANFNQLVEALNMPGNNYVKP